MVPIGLPVPGTSLDGYDPLAEVRAYESIADWFTTDTINSSNETKAFGCSGNVTSVAQVCGVVNSTTRPVIVAGGMSGTNVADVWAICRPAGFDAHSAVCLEGVPNYERSKAFVDAVRALDE